MFNFWKSFPKHQPKHDGWYLCSVEVPNQQRYVMPLWWDGEFFLNNYRQNVFDTYKVINMKGERIYTDILCNRTKDVKYWKNEPRTCYKGFRINNEPP